MDSNICDIFEGLTKFHELPYIPFTPDFQEPLHFYDKEESSKTQQQEEALDLHHQNITNINHHIQKIDEISEKSRTLKRKPSAAMHNVYERRRRSRINKKFRDLRALIPKCNKPDIASMLDDATEYLKALKLQVEVLSKATSCGGGCVRQLYSYVAPHEVIGVVQSGQNSHFGVSALAPMRPSAGAGMASICPYAAYVQGMSRLVGSDASPIAPWSRFIHPTPLTGCSALASNLVRPIAYPPPASAAVQLPSGPAPPCFPYPNNNCPF